MGIRRQWKIVKLSQLSTDESVRNRLIESIMRRQKAQVQLYAWDTNAACDATPRAFFSENEAVRDWYVKTRVWEEAKCPSGVVLRKWSMGVDELLQYVKEGEVRNVPIPPTVEMDVGIIPSTLHEDMQQTLKKQA
jgi:hypothetical protein